jgi:CBS domain-containing protein
MRPVAGAFAPELSVADALAWLNRESLDAWPVANGEGLTGIIRRAELESSNGTEVLGNVVKPVDHDFAHVHPDHSLNVALERIGASGLQIIPVVSRANAKDLLGVAVLNDILRAYGVKR